MDISIVGATGGCGRELASQLIRDQVLERREILQLVSSNPSSRHPNLLHGLRADLQDAYAEIVPEIDVTDDPEQIIGDVIIMSAGATLSTNLDNAMSRDQLAFTNVQIFERFAQAIANSKKGNPPMIIIVSNPVELGVHIFSQYIPRHYVIGMGAYSDSMRFRWEIAHDLGIRRQRVHAYMFGEHGSEMVPIWSSVRVQGMNEQEWKMAKSELTGDRPVHKFPDVLEQERHRIMSLLKSGKKYGPNEAINYINSLTPDLRVALKPFAIHYTQAKTQIATAAATSDLIKSIFQGRATEVAVQYQLEGELGIHVPFGVTVILDGKVKKVLEVHERHHDEKVLLNRSAKLIQEKIKKWTSNDRL